VVCREKATLLSFHPARAFLAIVTAACAATMVAQAGLITSVPGPDDQGGMIMPMVYITNTDNPNDPTRGTLAVLFDPHSSPVLAGLQYWSPGSWFDATAAWRADLGSPAGAGGTPAANAGRGDLFNSQYGFTFWADPAQGWAYVPWGKSLAIRLKSRSSSLLLAYNYDDFDNIWDEVLSPGRPQVLWDGTMWHNYFTLPADAQPGIYTATYEVFIADAEFQGGTGFVDYSPPALAAVADPDFTPVTVTYTWVVPSPPVATISLASGQPVVSFAPVKNAIYRLQYKDSLDAVNWVDVGDSQRGVSGVTMNFPDATSPRPSRRFYQIVETR
jgi:hypothetical protein